MVSTMTQPKILVIDDEDLFREMLQVVLAEEYQVLSASSAEEGLKLLQQEHPDVVLLDIVMPGRTGIQGLRAIRNVDTEVAIIMITGFPKLETAEQAITFGANDYVEKPIKPEEIRNKVRTQLERTQETKRKSRTFREMSAMLKELSARREQQKKQALESAAAVELMHDLRYPLENVLEQLKEVSASLDPASGQLTMAEETVRRCHELTALCREMAAGGREAKEPLSLEGVLHEVVTEIKPVASAGGVELDYRAHLQSDVVNASSRQLKRALRNLVSNAVEATSASGGTVVRVACSERNGHIEIRVEDHGNGFDVNELRRELGTQFSRREVMGGAGVGLGLTRHIIEDMGGRVNVQTAKGKGCVVFVTLPKAGK